MNKLALKVTFRVGDEKITAVEIYHEWAQIACQWTVKGICSYALKEKIDLWMTSYLARKAPQFDLPMHLEDVSPYTQEVLAVLRKVPFGKKLTYGEVAKRTGRPAAARAAGTACGRNPLPLLIPCHRIIGADGALRGFSAGGMEVKKLLLQHESNDE